MLVNNEQKRQKRPSCRSEADSIAMAQGNVFQIEEHMVACHLTNMVERSVLGGDAAYHYYYM